MNKNLKIAKKLKKYFEKDFKYSDNKYSHCTDICYGIKPYTYNFSVIGERMREVEFWFTPFGFYISTSFFVANKDSVKSMVDDFNKESFLGKLEFDKDNEYLLNYTSAETVYGARGSQNQETMIKRLNQSLTDLYDYTTKKGKIILSILDKENDKSVLEGKDGVIDFVFALLKKCVPDDEFVRISSNLEMTKIENGVLHFESSNGDVKNRVETYKREFLWAIYKIMGLTDFIVVKK